MKKKVLVIMLVIGILALNIMTVNANEDIYDILGEQCVIKKTCMVVCTYGRAEAPDVMIFYDFVDKEWRVLHEAGDFGMHAGYIVKSGKYNHVFSKSGNPDIYIPKKHTNDKFTCPNYGYRDLSFISGGNEVCFDNNGKWCEEDKSNFGTDFSPYNKLYDFNDELKNYFDLWYQNDVKSSLSCDSIKNEENKEIAKNLIDRFKSDMESMFVFNGATAEQLPSFVINSPSWNYVVSTISDDVVEVANDCQAQADQAYENGEISAEEYGNIINTVSELIQITETETELQLNPNINGATSEYWNQQIECEDIFEFDKEGSVGWMLQTIFNYIKVLGPIIVVLLSSIDFIKAVVGTDEKAMKEAQSKLIIRLIAALALFLIPTLIQLLLSFINITLSDGCYVK